MILSGTVFLALMTVMQGGQSRRSLSSTLRHPLSLLLLTLPIARGIVLRQLTPGPAQALLNPAASQRASGVVAREIPLLKDVEAYEGLISSATAENRIVCIKFYASWCRACKAMAPKFEKVCRYHLACLPTSVPSLRTIR